MSRTVWRILGVEVFSRESDEVPAEEPLTAADNGGEMRSDRIDVGFRIAELPNQHWPDGEDE